MPVTSGHALAAQTQVAGRPEPSRIGGHVSFDRSTELASQIVDAIMRTMLRLSLALAASLCAAIALGQQPPTDAVDAAFAAALPPIEESRWTLIPWRRSLTEALAESRLTGKPVFLYVNDGEVASGRC